MISPGYIARVTRILSSFAFRAGFSSPLIIRHLRGPISIINGIIILTETNLKNGDVFNVWPNAIHFNLLQFWTPVPPFGLSVFLLRFSFTSSHSFKPLLMIFQLILRPFHQLYTWPSPFNLPGIWRLLEKHTYCPYNLMDWRGQEIKYFASHEEKQPRVCKNNDKHLCGKCLNLGRLDFCHQVLLFYRDIEVQCFMSCNTSYIRVHLKFLYAEKSLIEDIQKQVYSPWSLIRANH